MNIAGGDIGVAADDEDEDILLRKLVEGEPAMEKRAFDVDEIRLVAGDAGVLLPFRGKGDATAEVAKSAPPPGVENGLCSLRAAV